MTIRQIDDVLWVQEIALDLFDVRGALILGDTHAAVWDTLSHPRDMEAFLPLIGNRELIIIYSHADWDHIWGTGGFTRAFAHVLQNPLTIIAHQLCRNRFLAEVPQTLHKKQTAEPNLWDDVKLYPPTITFEQLLTIDLGNLTLELRHLPGHTEDCLVAYIHETEVALMGDTIETPFPVVPKNSPIHNWIAELEWWLHVPTISTVIPSHGPIGGRELIEQTIDYLQKLQTGAEIEVPKKLTDFYRETHESNLRWK